MYNQTIWLFYAIWFQFLFNILVNIHTHLRNIEKLLWTFISKRTWKNVKKSNLRKSFSNFKLLSPRFIHIVRKSWKSYDSRIIITQAEGVGRRRVAMKNGGDVTAAMLFIGRRTRFWTVIYDNTWFWIEGLVSLAGVAMIWVHSHLQQRSLKNIGELF